ncbi:MAG: Nif3-like dinuclear metal center hexameric protein [Flavobacteriales bacterium]|nr:Nif3-like dinuclear metal center hexameric protein [Flavobacteriales bacterium]
MHRIKDITDLIEEFAPLSYQEDYDNCGLIIGDNNNIVTGVLISIDVTEDVVNEAVQKKCNLIIAHHPILFGGIKKITKKTYVGKTIISAIKNDISIYAAHTNVDNVYNGVNYKIAQKIGLINNRILSEKSNILDKLVVYCPISAAEVVRNSMFESGAGSIGNYSDCSFNSQGQGTFKPNSLANPFVGKTDELHIENELKIEVVVPKHLTQKVIHAMKITHPYEEVAYDIFELKNSTTVGSGLVGELKNEVDELQFLTQLKNIFHSNGIRYTNILNKKVKKVAVCGGSGSFLIENAIQCNADVFISSDFKYHQFFDANNKILIADIGHYESEQFTKEIFYELLTKKIINFAVHLSEINTNPINYL